MNTSEVLNRTADLIEERGWVQGASGWKSGGALCLEGGILVALGMSWEDMSWTVEDFQSCPAYTAVAEHLATGGELYVWNDSTAKSAAEVIETLRACALIEAARENTEARTVTAP